jgi:hypothetical protein
MLWLGESMYLCVPLHLMRTGASSTTGVSSWRNSVPETIAYGELSVAYRQLVIGNGL